MISRFFAFGCSYTTYDYPTWADYVGVNFDEYYNYAKAGASNTFIMNKLVEANEFYKFNPESDTVMIMLTGFNRFSYMDVNTDPNKTWLTHGDIPSYIVSNKHDDVMRTFHKNMWTENFAIYQSWIAVKVIKTILSQKNIKHKILMGIDNSHYLNESVPTIHDDTKSKVREIYNLLDYPMCLDEWKNKNRQSLDVLIWKNSVTLDSHPTHRSHYKFAHTFFPELLGDKSIDLLEFWNNNITYESQQKQGQLYDSIFRVNYSFYHERMF